MTARKRLVIACSVLVGVALVAVTGYKIIGGPSVTLVDAIYMAVTTVTTVGYGEIVDTSHNPRLRIFNIFVVMLGVGFALYVFSELTAFLVEGELHDLFRRRRMKRQIDELNQHFIVCGAGETGRHVSDELRKTKTPHVVIDSAPEVIERLHGDHSGSYERMLYVIGDASDEEVLMQAGLARAKGIIAALPSDKDNLVITVVARQKSQAIRIISRCTDLRYSDRMLKVGANSTVSPNRIGALRMASEMLRPTVVSFLDLMLQEKSRTLRIDEVELSAAPGWVGRKIGDLELSARYDLLLLALKSLHNVEQPIVFNPSPDLLTSPEHVLVLMGDVENLRRAREEASK